MEVLPETIKIRDQRIDSILQFCILHRIKLQICSYTSVILEKVIGKDIFKSAAGEHAYAQIFPAGRN